VLLWLLEGTSPVSVYVFFVKSQLKRPETRAYLENTTLLIKTKLGFQGLILRLTGEVIRTNTYLFVLIASRPVLVYRFALKLPMLTVF
jgi:hypothetical protein